MPDDPTSVAMEMLAFGPRQRLKAGTKWYHVVKAPVDDKEFWNLWREFKDELKAEGFRVTKNDDGFDVARWVEATEDGEAPPADTRVVRYFTDVEFHIPEDLVAILKPEQVLAVRTLIVAIRKHRLAIDASETGRGKTYIACAVAKLLGWNVGVVCPATVVSKWIDTMVDVFDIEPEFVLSYDKLRLESADAEPYITRTDVKGKKSTKTSYVWHATAPVLLIFDEIHKCAALGSLNSKVLEAAVKHRFIKVLGLSATAVDSPMNLDVIGLGLGLHAGNWWDWALKVGCRPGMFGGLDFNRRAERSQVALKNIHHFIFPERGTRVRKSDSTSPGSELFVEILDAEYTSKPVREAVDRLDLKMIEDERRAAEKNQTLSSFVESTRARQFAELGKVSGMVDKAEELVEEGYSVVMFLAFTESIQCVEQLLHKNIRYRKFVGGGGKQRDAQLADFQSNKASVLIVQLDAGAASVDMHDLDGDHPRATLVSSNYDHRVLIQALGRVDRVQSASKSLQFIVFSHDPIEKRLAALVQSKLDNLSLITDAEMHEIRLGGR